MIYIKLNLRREIDEVDHLANAMSILCSALLMITCVVPERYIYEVVDY